MSSCTSSSQLPLKSHTKRKLSTVKKDKALVGSGLRCSICSKTYAHHRSLHNHLMTHRGENPFVCSFCEKAFHRQDSLGLHLRVHTGERPYTCETCGRGFTQKCALTTHMSASPSCVTLPQKPTDTEPRAAKKDAEKVLLDSGLKCTICSKTYAHRRSLRNHLMTHRGENPFLCSYCGKSFHRRDLLKLHLRAHTGEKPYVCEVCGRGFARKSGLTYHMVVHSRK